MDFDVIIKNVKIIDGLGKNRSDGEVGVSGDVIKAVADAGALRNSGAGLVIDGKGCALSPGFIDIHSHDDIVPWDDVYNEPKLRQGVTTCVAGMCGSSVFPLPENNSPLLEDLRMEKKWQGPDYPWTARTLREYALQVEERRPAINLVPAVGHGAIRISVMGYSARPPAADEFEAMKSLLEESLQAGAVGMSTGLIYPPGSYAREDEITGLAGILGDYGRMYFTHLRYEGVRMDTALEEAVRICSAAGIPLHVAHFKCLGRQSWGDAEKRLAFVAEAREKGLKVSWDQYPYTASSTGLLSMLPPDAQRNGIRALLDELKSSSFQKMLIEEIRKEDMSWENFYIHAGGWERIILSGAPGFEELEGHSIAELAEKSGKPPFQTLFELIGVTRGTATMVVYCMAEDDLERILLHPSTCIGSDGISVRGKVHPRLFGAFPRVLGLYAREKRLFPMEEAVRRMTSLPAGILGLNDRGVIKEGYKADMVIFDYERVRDKADYENPRQYPEGISHVFVNGKAVLADGALRKERPGRVLLRS